jgi:hypothetical protein
LVHWWHLFWRVVPEARQALDQVAAFLEKLWANQAVAKVLPRASEPRPVARRRAA